MEGVLQGVQQQYLALTQPGQDTPWTSAQWHEAFVYLFCPEPGAWRVPSGTEEADDLLFFVYSSWGAAAHGAPFTVRRQTSGLPPELAITGTHFSEVDWPRTVALNLVLHSAYELTVIACSQEALPQVAEGLADVPGVVSVTRRVYPSPSHVTVNLETSKAHAPPAPTYPNIHFAVDGFDDGATFQDMLLIQPDDCYCVLLHALRWPTLQHLTHAGPSAQSAPAAQQRQRVQLFSGYVQKDAVVSHLAALPKSAVSPVAAVLGRLFGGRLPADSSLLHKQSSSGHHNSCNKVIMNGPAGVGKAEVAVATVQDVSASAAAPTSARHLSSTQGTGNRAVTGQVLVQLQCAIMSIALPVDELARLILLAIDP